MSHNMRTDTHITHTCISHGHAYHAHTHITRTNITRTYAHTRTCAHTRTKRGQQERLALISGKGLVPIREKGRALREGGAAPRSDGGGPEKGEGPRYQREGLSFEHIVTQRELLTLQTLRPRRLRIVEGNGPGANSRIDLLLSGGKINGPFESFAMKSALCASSRLGKVPSQRATQVANGE
eukprot:6196633-Pleurochrysis_carterae.AAC.2